MGLGMRTQAPLHVHTAPELWLGGIFFRAALPPQKPYGLLGTEEEWDRE